MKIMSSKAFLLLALVAAVVLLVSSEVVAKDLAETSTEKKNGQLGPLSSLIIVHQIYTSISSCLCVIVDFNNLFFYKLH